ncbi:hypothetical protein HAHE_12960 [Haloferula helveola]|uniref:CAAX prenyl protease 2/Lysostaphin resistance protein A-like domain-containing protein n=1 Tax=Haloferula helveola TaxID=490095 RepID=A0ABM7RCJ9_9BACT|nr:hypothetical protein HAHE_12960 [Haloferula helveola]
MPPVLAPTGKSADCPDIQTPATNPYRQLLRRRFPEPLVLLLIFLVGVYLWDNHFGKVLMPHAPAQRTELLELALRKADRDLRLADGTAQYPSWVQPLLGVDPLPQSLDHHISALEPLIYSRHRHEEDAMTAAIEDEAAFALAVMISIQAGGDGATAPFAKYGLNPAPPPGPILSTIIDGREAWWHMAYLEGLDIPEAAMASRLVDARTQQLVGNMIKSRGCVAALTLGGLVFIPGTLVAFVRAGKRRERPGYAGRWKLSFGLGVFLLAYLASIGFSSTFNEALGLIAANADPEAGPLMSKPLYIALDSLTRFLPAFIALGLLFRRPRHAVSRLGIAGPFDARLVLGSFAILQIIDFGLRMTVDRSETPDPTGGLSASELGPWGLVFGIVSACIAAPIAEEILYRGVLFRSLANRLKLWPATLVSSVVFAIVHFYPLSSLVMIACVGMVCALSFAASRGLLTAIVLHSLYNAAIKIPEWIVYQTTLS